MRVFFHLPGFNSRSQLDSGSLGGVACGVA
jgi:hypothetical protein